MPYGEDNFEQPLSSVDKELAEALAQLDEVIIEDIRDQIGDEAYEKYLEMKALDDMVEDSLDSDSKSALAKQRSKDMTWLIHSRHWDDDFIESFSETTESLIDKIELLLVDRYPELEVASINEGSVTFYILGDPVDYEKKMTKKLMVIFTAHGKDIMTSVAYSYVPLPFTKGKPYREDLDVDSLAGKVANISINTLKSDALKAIRTVLDHS